MVKDYKRGVSNGHARWIVHCRSHHLLSTLLLPTFLTHSPPGFFTNISIHYSKKDTHIAPNDFIPGIDCIHIITMSIEHSYNSELRSYPLFIFII